MAISIIAISIQAGNPIACFWQLHEAESSGIGMIKENFDLLVVALLALSIAMYDAVMELCLNLLHLIFGILHILYEWLELGIEHGVEHLFHTSRHGSQIITFYILLSIGALLMLWLYRLLPGLWRQFTGCVRRTWERRKTECQIYWLSLPLSNKLKLISTAGIFFLASYVVM